MHLANENCLKFERKIHENLEEDEGEDLVFKGADAPVPKGRKGRKGAKNIAAKTNIIELMEK